MATAIAVWTVGYALQISVIDLGAKQFWANIEYLGISTIPITWLLFTMDFTSGNRWLSNRQISLLCVVPAITILLVWTDDLHGLVRTHTGVLDAGGYVLAVVTYGPWFWVHTVFSYTLHIVGTVMIARFLIRSPPLYKRQATLILTGVLVPTFLNIIYLLRLNPYPNLDLTPFGFIIMGFASFWALRQFRLFDIVPVARDTIIERMSEGVVVLDHQDRIIDINPSARSIFGCADDNCIGLKAESACPELLADRSDGITEVTRDEGFERRFFEVETMPLEDKMENTRGKLIVLREITQRERAEEEQIRTQRLAAVGELSAGISHHLNNILTGILAPADLLLEENQTPKHRRDLERIVAAAIRARDLVRRLRSTARGSDTTEIAEVDVCDTIEEAIVAAKPRLKDEPEFRGVQIKVATNLLDVPTVQGTRLGLHNVLLNLFFNGVDAIEDRGAITITTKLQDEQVVIEVQDNGIGMSENACLNRFSQPKQTWEPDWVCPLPTQPSLGAAEPLKSGVSWNRVQLSRYHFPSGRTEASRLRRNRRRFRIRKHSLPARFWSLRMMTSSWASSPRCSERRATMWIPPSMVKKP